MANHSYRLLPLAILALTFASGPAAAQAPPAGAAPGEAWEIGVRANYFTPDPFVGYFYDESETLTGIQVGGFLTRHSAGGNRVIFGLHYSMPGDGDGVWLEAGEDASSREYVEFRDFAVIEAHAIVGKEWSFGPFGLFTGAGLGIAAIQGSVTSYEMVAGTPVIATADKKKIPPVVPTIIVRAGPTVKIGPMITLYGDVGFHNGLYAGTAVGLKF